MFKKVLTGVFAGIMLLSMVSVAAVCDSGIDPMMEATITIGGWSPADVAMNGVIPLFNAKYPNIKVVLPENIDSDAGPFMTNLQSSLVAGAGAPDVVMIEEKFIGAFKDMGFLENLLEAPTMPAGCKKTLSAISGTRLSPLTERA